MPKECRQCGEVNMDSAVNCALCNAPLPHMATVKSTAAGGIIYNDNAPAGRAIPVSDATPAYELVYGNKTPGPALELTDRGTNTVITITGAGTIGRSGNIERGFFARDMYVSNYHCDVIFENGNFYIEHLHTAKNQTCINRARLAAGVPMLIRDRDTLTIADKIFKVAVRGSAADAKGCAPGGMTGGAGATAGAAAAGTTAGAAAASAAIGISENVKADSAPQYEIICPKCGSAYIVSGPGEKIKECLECDEYDKYEIFKAGARVKQ